MDTKSYRPINVLNRQIQLIETKIEIVHEHLSQITKKVGKDSDAHSKLLKAQELLEDAMMVLSFEYQAKVDEILSEQEAV